ncbi:MAG: TlpA family protein disulfide reductase [Thermodesulfobacteriota bacterium]
MEKTGVEVLSRRDLWKFCMKVAGTFLLPVAFWPAAAEASLRVGDTLPTVSLPDLKGNKITLPSDFPGKVILVHFWASWCSFCIKEMVAIESIYNSYGGKGLIPFSINVGENRGAAESYLANMRVSYPVLLDSTSGTARQYGVTGIPTTFLCDRKGVIRFKVLGEVNQEGLKRILSSLF